MKFLLEIAENERNQRHQMQKEFENRMKSQKLHIVKLREELENVRSVSLKIV